MSDGNPEDRDERATLVESKFNIDRAAGIEVAPFIGLGAKDFSQLFEFSKAMSLAGPMIPAFCRNRPWVCLAIVVQAMEWHMSPFSVAKQSYEVENRRTGERTVAYQSQLLHAVLEARAPLKERLRVRFENEGDDMTCTVWATFKGENEPREWKSPRLGDRRPKPQKHTNSRTGETYESTSGSPLWQSKPMVQLFYDTSRDWARIYCPDIILSIYTKDELESAGFIDVTPHAPPVPEDDGGLAQRLTESALARAGFSVERTVAAIDEGRRGADINPGRGDASHENVGHGQGGEDIPSRASPPPAPEAQGSPAAVEESAKGEDSPEAQEGRQRGPQRRRRRSPQGEGDPEQAGLV